MASRAYDDARADRWRLCGGWCEADGLHHADCPGALFTPTDYSGPMTLVAGAVTHHVLPRAKGGRDHVDNLRWVWNGHTGLGQGGCHGRIHAEQRDVHDDAGHVTKRGSLTLGLLERAR